MSVGDFDRDGKPLANSVVGGCIWPDHSGGVVHVATIVNTTAAQWMFQLDQPCTSLAIDPNNADHILVNNASNGVHVYESNDGGRTYHGCMDERGAVMVAIDRQGWFYHAAEGGAFRNMGGDCVNVGGPGDARLCYMFLFFEFDPSALERAKQQRRCARRPR